MSIRYYIYREESGRTVAEVGFGDTMDEAKSRIRAAGRPGRYALYEHPHGENTGVCAPPVELGYMIISPAGWLWERRDSKPIRQHDHWRDDGWSVYLTDGPFPVWQLCQPDGQKVPVKAGSASDPLDQVLAWADVEIAKMQGGTLESIR